MAKVKGVVVESVRSDGYAILNADDDHVYAMKNNLDCNVALFSMDENSERIKAHSKKGGLSAIYENGYVTICKGEWKIRIQRVVSIPLTYGGRAGFMIQNILPATIVGFLNGFKIDDIRTALETFIPSASQTPGRLNLFNFKDYDVLLDYAHNPAGLRALHHFIEKIENTPKVGIIAGIGDRRDEDNIEIGRICAEMFDEIIIRQDKHLRGKKDHEIIDLLTQGIKSHDPNKKLTVIPKESEAISYAIKNVKKGSLIVICIDVVTEALALVQKYKEEEANKLYDYKHAEIPNIEDVNA
jgi:cyanophycin synthetase